MQQQNNNILTEEHHRLSQDESNQRREGYLRLLRNRHRYDDGCDEEDYNDDDADCYCEQSDDF